MNTTLEVADQWRREWAGAAEYGKVTEGGVTRQVARALEVLHASGPGARVRVLRAAWHSSAGPGAPASSYMMHSSRQVISSGSRLLSSPSLRLSKPLEISSTPLDASPDENTDTENYKVTEPDDFDISGPSKWKSSRKRSSFRMPSEESSSTENSSIIDLDSRYNTLNKSIGWRRHSCDSENSDQRPTSRTSPLLDAPVTLSTLKFKSLLNNSNECWNNRRKSYSFEDTSSVNEPISNSSDTLAMESSTDSGICKSTEIVNEPADESYEKYFEKATLNGEPRTEETFKDWLARKRPNKIHKGVELKAHKEYVSSEEPLDNRIGLQSIGKVSISVAHDPIIINHRIIEDDDNKRTKRVEFCKTELHFAADSGKVNIIATDEKPPPSNDFRKRRSAFVPIKGHFDKPVTLFGEKFDDLLVINRNNITAGNDVTEVSEEENTAATKSILKNKIPKPKPYLLGENMEFGEKDTAHKTMWEHKTTPTLAAIPSINEQFEAEPKCIKKTAYECKEKSSGASNEIIHKIEKPKNKGLSNSEPCRNLRTVHNNTEDQQNISPKQHYIAINVKENNDSAVRNTLKILQSSPVLQTKSRTRQLKESDLTYFGVIKKEKEELRSKRKYSHQDMKTIDDMFNTARLVQQASNNTPRADESFSSDYQNLPIKSDYIPIPTPRSLFKIDKYDNNSIDLDKKIKPSEEQFQYTHKSRLKTNGDTNEKKYRSHSEPPKYRLSYHQDNNKNDFNLNLRQHEVITEQHGDSPVPSLGEYSRNNIKDGCRMQSRKGHGDEIVNKDRVATKVNKKHFIPLYENLAFENTTMNRETKDKAEDNSLPKNEERKSRSRLSNRKGGEYQTNSLLSKGTLNKKQKSLDQIKQHSNKEFKEKSSIAARHNLKCKEENCKSIEKLYNQPKQTNSSKTNGKARTVALDSSELEKTTRMRNKDNVKKDAQRREHISNVKGTTLDDPKEKSLLKSNTSSIEHPTDYKKISSLNDKKGIVQDLKLHKWQRRNEYVLNYDDKNGTFSSMNKIKHNSKSNEKTKTDSSRKKNSSESKKVAKTNEKHSLPQSAGHHNIQNGYSKDKKWKRKTYIERTCQIL